MAPTNDTTRMKFGQAEGGIGEYESVGILMNRRGCVMLAFPSSQFGNSASFAEQRMAASRDTGDAGASLGEVSFPNVEPAKKNWQATREGCYRLQSTHSGWPGGFFPPT